MRDEYKTKKELINELLELHRWVHELESKTELIDELTQLRQRGIELEEREREFLKIGGILMERGYVTKQQLEEALKEQEKMRKEGSKAMLLDIMVQSGIITGEQMRTVLHLQELQISMQKRRLIKHSI